MGGQTDDPFWGGGVGGGVGWGHQFGLVGVVDTMPPPLDVRAAMLGSGSGSWADDGLGVLGGVLVGDDALQWGSLGVTKGGVGRSKGKPEGAGGKGNGGKGGKKVGA